MDKADAWFHNWNKGEGHSWEEFEFEIAIYNRFGERGLEDVIEEFNRLRQAGNVEDYQNAFKELRVRMERLVSELKESYF